MGLWLCSVNAIKETNTLMKHLRMLVIICDSVRNSAKVFIIIFFQWNRAPAGRLGGDPRENLPAACSHSHLHARELLVEQRCWKASEKGESEWSEEYETYSVHSSLLIREGKDYHHSWNIPCILWERATEGCVQRRLTAMICKRIPAVTVKKCDFTPVNWYVIKDEW